MSESDISEVEDVWSPGAEPVEPDLEAPEADAVEQQQDVLVADDEPPAVPYDVDPADAAEQSRTVPYDEDDYR
ncbi:MAG: hypothetical protein ICV70_00030 [Jiangellaceae bacterium]|nr:hypothetical protein [Jiangellaceae bacterium]